MTVELQPLPFDYDALEDDISADVVEWHHDTHQQGYVDGYNSYLEEIESMRESGDFSGIRSVKQGQTHNGSGMYLHELYWEALDGDGGRPSGDLLRQLREDFGSFTTFKHEFQATAKAARGWAILVWWPRTERLEIVMVDFHDVHALWGAQPLLPVDVWEHAYYYDRGPNKQPYLDGVFNNVDWSFVADRLEEVR